MPSVAWSRWPAFMVGGVGGSQDLAVFIYPKFPHSLYKPMTGDG